MSSLHSWKIIALQNLLKFLLKNHKFRVVTLLSQMGDRPLVLGILIIPYPTAFPYGNGTVLHFYQQQESSTTKTVHKVINKGLKTYV